MIACGGRGRNPLEPNQDYLSNILKVSPVEVTLHGPTSKGPHLEISVLSSFILIVEQECFAVGCYRYKMQLLVEQKRKREKKAISQLLQMSGGIQFIVHSLQ